MTRWHIETLRLAVSLIALILAFFITCKMANDIEARIDAENYAMNSKNVINYKDAMGYNIDFEENDTKQKQTEYYNDFDQREEKTVTKPDEANFRVSVKSDENKAKLTTVTDPVITRKYCVNIANTLRARHKSCFLRPDTGPCRADIIQWYFDARLSKCFRFFWGGCQGNGNKFETRRDCMGYCYLDGTMGKEKLPYFCKLAFDFGSCFGHYYRWYWDKYSKTCKRRLYSGCGGNQNNFQSYKECFATCVVIPNDTLRYTGDKGTTCFPL